MYALASGNLGQVSSTQRPERMSREQIEEAFPAMIPGLAQHEGVGFVMVRSQKDGPVVIGAQSVYYLNEDRFEGKNPLAPFGRNAPDHLRRTDSFPNCPDILVNSFYDPETDEGCAFEASSASTVACQDSRPSLSCFTRPNCRWARTH